MQLQKMKDNFIVFLPIIVWERRSWNHWGIYMFSTCQELLDTVEFSESSSHFGNIWEFIVKFHVHHCPHFSSHYSSCKKCSKINKSNIIHIPFSACICYFYLT